MADLSVADWMAAKDAPAELVAWAVNSETMADVWTDCPSVWCVWIATRAGVLTDYELRYFAATSADAVVEIMTNPAGQDAVTAAVDYADGNITLGQMAVARRDAWSAAVSTGGAAGIATMSAARACGVDGEWALDAATTAASAASRHAIDVAIAADIATGETVYPASYVTTGADALGDAQDAQAAYLRASTAPQFAA